MTPAGAGGPGGEPSGEAEPRTGEVTRRDADEEPGEGSPDGPGGARPAAGDAAEPLTGPPVGPPGGRIFTLEGRQAPGLYLVAWVLCVAGLAFFLVLGPMASDSAASLVLISLGALATTVGLAAACGYQIVERRDRHPDRYRGPSPLLVFFTFYFALTIVGLAAVSVTGFDPLSPGDFFLAGLVQAVGYVVVVWLFVVRGGALGWGEMGWPTWRGPSARSILRAVGWAIAVMLPAMFGVLILGGILALILGVEAPDVLPTPRDQVEALGVVLVAAILAPVGEELFFRGFALTAWGRDLGARSAIIRSSVFFALIHIVNISSGTFAEGAAQAILQTAVILPLGFVLGWLFVRHGMAAAIAGHVTYNSLLLVLRVIAESAAQGA